MAWFWRTRSLLEPDDEEWLLACWHWLSEKFPGTGLQSDRELVLPTAAFFSVATGDGHEAALHYSTQVASHLGVDPGQFELVAQEASVDAILGPMQVVENAPGGPAGTFSVDGERMVITYEPSLVNHPMELIAAFAHELCHPLLFSIGEGPPGGEDMEEFATDLALPISVSGFSTATPHRSSGSTAMQPPAPRVGLSSDRVTFHQPSGPLPSRCSSSTIRPGRRWLAPISAAGPPPISARRCAISRRTRVSPTAAARDAPRTEMSRLRYDRYGA
ncbi:hypothetical protein FQ775_06985 [Nitratireductor mangrovi]|uniref:Uncharacterized protein n=1 Tax=Nitratireductor mangrovi TaxID=2599600 RepID=A0A5B8KX47_9HYPH|nr:hypothetical protein [Nitratireductor mangrovi]QDZ00146.1 hypothetical protein FQ775_06985 [Nitratireductor mangrovi]